MDIRLLPVGSHYKCAAVSLVLHVSCCMYVSISVGWVSRSKIAGS